MGVGIAESLVLAGFEVVVTDVTPARSGGARAAGRRMHAHAEAGLIDREAAELATTVRAPTASRARSRTPIS